MKTEKHNSALYQAAVTNWDLKAGAGFSGGNSVSRYPVGQIRKNILPVA
jgi:hypothetical protein